MPARSCGIARFVLWRSDRNCWWFRRPVPGDLVRLIGKREWRQTLKARSRADAEREAIPLLDETNRTIDLALAGNWPPISDEEIEAVAVGWWIEFRETQLIEMHRKGWLADRLWDVDASEWALSDENELAQSVGQFIAGPRNLDYVFRPELDLIQALLDNPQRASGLVRNKDAMMRLLRDCRLNHHAVAGGWGVELQERERATGRVLAAIHAGKLEPQEIIARMIEKQPAAIPELQARRVGAKSPILFNDPEGGDDLIAKWAKWRKPRPKTVYETRRIMRKLTEFVGFDDLTQLSKPAVERWLEHLDDSGAAPKTLEGHLLTLKTLANFAVEKDMISDNPIAKIRYRAKANPRKKIRAYTNTEARTVLAAARLQQRDYMRWLPWLACFTGARLDEIAAADVRDVERLGRYWVLNIRLDYRANDASIKTENSHRRVPVHKRLLAEGFLTYVRGLPKDGPLFPSLRADKFGSKAGTATKKIGPFVRALATDMPSLADRRLSPNHSWRHRLINECRRIPVREDIEHALTGHAQEGTAPDYGEYAINTMLGPAIDKTRSPFDVPSDVGDEDIGNPDAIAGEELSPGEMPAR
jgi:integrase